MTTSFLIRSRHGTTLYYRRRVPNDLFPLIGRHYLVRSLRTACRSTGIIAARQLAVNTDNAFELLRTMPKKDAETLLQTNLTMLFDFDLGGKLRTAKVRATPEEAEQAHAIFSKTLESIHNLTGSGSGPSVPNAVASALISSDALFEDFFVEGTATSRWNDAEKSRKHDYNPVWRTFSEYTNEHGLTRSAATAYRDALVLNPQLSVTTKERNLTYVSAVLKHGIHKFGLPSDICTPLRLQMSGGRGKSSSVKSYQPFSADDLSRLFGSVAYRTNSFKKPSHFWLPLLGLYSGARIDELAGIHLEEFQQVDGFPAVLLSSRDTTNGGKNEYAPRLFPIHQALIAAGLLDYVALLQAEKHIRLFPDIQKAERDGFGKRATDDFTHYRRSERVRTAATGGRSQKAFHSFRSTVSGKLYELGIDSDLSRRLVGHAPVDVHAGRYLKFAPIPMERATEAINRISYGLTHFPFVDTPAYRKARKRRRYSKRPA